jgi:hypothetical protein
MKRGGGCDYIRKQHPFTMCVHVCMCACVHVCMDKCEYACTCVRVYVGLWLCENGALSCECVRVCAHALRGAHAHTHNTYVFRAGLSSSDPTFGTHTSEEPAGLGGG